MAKPPDYPNTLAATIQISCRELADVNPRALELLTVCSVLAPEPIPDLVLSTGRPSGGYGSDEGQGSGSPDIYGPLDESRAIAQMIEYALARRGRNGLVLHRLTQSIVRNQMEHSELSRAVYVAQRRLAAAHPGPGRDPETWGKWELLMPHVIAVHSETSRTAEFRELTCDGAFYLLSRGEAKAATCLLTDVSTAWRRELGPDHLDTLRANHLLAIGLRYRGDLAQARSLNEDTLHRRMTQLGPDHFHTLMSANSLGNDLYEMGQAAPARDLHQDSLRRRRRILGDDHVETLNSAHNLANALRELGDFERARDLDSDVLARRIRKWGQEHPHTYYSMESLGKDLLLLGKVDDSLAILGLAYQGRSDLLGANHPETFQSGSSLARALLIAGRREEAEVLNNEILARRVEVLGEQHPDTERSRRNLKRISHREYGDDA